MTPPLAAASPLPGAGEALATTSSLLWALGAILFVRIPRGVSASAMNLAKNAVGSVAFVALLAIEPGGAAGALTSAAPDRLLALVLAGLLGLGACDILLFRAFRAIGPRRVNVVMATSPVLVAALALLPPLGEHPTWLLGAGMTVCVVALWLAARERPLPGVEPGTAAAGLRDAGLAAVLQAAGFVLTRWGMQDAALSVSAGAAVRLVAGTAGLVLWGLLRGRLGTWAREITAHRALGPLLLAALVGTVGGIWTNQAGIAWAAHVGAAATLNALAPVWLVPLSRVFLGEAHDRWAWASSLLAVAGVALVALG